MEDDTKATIPEQVVDANQAEPPKIEEQAVEATAVEDPVPEQVEAEVPITLKIKVQGEEKEVTLTRKELITKIQLAEDYHKKCAQLGEDKRRVAPYLDVIKSPEFHAWLSDQPTGGTKLLSERELFKLMKKGETIAAVELILRRGKERI